MEKENKILTEEKILKNFHTLPKNTKKRFIKAAKILLQHMIMGN
jgi:hypothetical protein